MKNLKFNDTILPDEIILKTRLHFVEICNACISEAKSGEVRVNDLEKYIKWNQEAIRNFKSGKADNSLTFLQRAYYLMTGDSIALLP